MATIVTRAGKGSPLTNTEVDSNFTNLDTYIDQRGNPLSMAVQVAITAATSASNGIQQLTNTQNNFDTGNFALQWRGSVPDWTPTADVILLNKHDGTNGYILTLLTTGFLRLTINATNFDSTVVTGMTDNYVAVIDVDITAATTTAAGSVVFTLNGVQLGTTLVISARVEKIVNGNFDTDITGWTLATGSGGTIAWNSGKLRVDRTSAVTSAYQAISLADGETLHCHGTATFVSGTATIDAQLVIRSSVSVSGPALALGNELLNSASGVSSVSYYSATAQTVYLHAYLSGGNGIYDFDTITSIDSATVDNTSSLYVCGTSAVRSASQWFSHRLFSRAKTVAENLAMFVNGMSVADVGASQTAFYTTDFSAGTNSWQTAAGITIAGNIDGIGGKDNNLRVTTDGTTNARTVRSLSLTGVKNGRWTFELYRPSANVTCVAVDARLTVGTSASGTISLGDYMLAADTWTKIVVEVPVSIITNSATALALYFADAAGSISNNTNGDIFYIASGSTFTQTGITSELLAQNAQTDNGQVLDSSGNKQHAKLAEAGMSTQGAISARTREVRWTNTWAGTNELQYIGGVNQAILPSNAYIESIVGTVSGATPHDIIIGNGSDADRYVTITTGLAAGTTTFTLASRTTDGTNLKLTVDPDTDATMSIAWVITYYRLES